MTREEAETAYPGAVDAVVVHESPHWVPIWDITRCAVQMGLSVQGVVTKIKSACDKTIADIRSMGDDPSRMMRIRQQQDHPDFLRYVGAKLGMM
jgi:hypothetical protein